MNALKDLVSNGILGEALSLLAEVIPDAAGCVAGACIAWALSGGMPFEGAHIEASYQDAAYNGFMHLYHRVYDTYARQLQAKDCSYLGNSAVRQNAWHRCPMSQLVSFR